MTGAIVEPLLLGFSSGLACLAACGPVLLPWLAAAGAGWGGTGARLAGFLAGRLAGYLVFATAAWALGLALPLAGGPGVVLAAVVDVALGALLAFYALRPARPGLAPCDARTRTGRLGPVTLGLLTGLNLCPPFVAAAVRAAQAHSLPTALGFFALFFAGTLVWFLPFLGVGAVRRFTAVPAIARFTAGLVAVYYGGRGIVILTGVLLHAWHART